MDAPQLRAALVERLLASPRTFAGLGWQRGWNLTHPGLGGQLAPVLTALADPGAPQPDPDQAYLALMLARQATPADVITPVLEAAARPGLEHGLRAVAARTVAMLDEAAAVPVLAGVLAEVSRYPGHDPDDELRGIALSVLWPRHLTADLLAASLTTPRRDNMLGAYYLFRRRLPGLLSDDDVPDLLGWALQAGPGQSAGPGALGSGGWLSRDDGELAEGLLDRAFACQDTDAVIGPAAVLAGRCLRDGRELHVPAALDDRDAAGALTGESRRLRRLLAGCRRSASMTPALAVHQLIWGWSRRGAAEERVLRSAPTRRSCLSALEAGPARGRRTCAGRWRLRQQPDRGGGHVDIGVARHLRTRPIGTRRRRPGRSGTRRCGPPSPPASPPSSLVPRPRRCSAASSTTCGRARPGGRARRRTPPRSLTFTSAPRPTRPRSPVLVYALHADPDDGRFAPAAGDDLASRPGVRLLPQGSEQHVREAAWHYLHQGTPPGPDILDTPDQLLLTALAGYLALAFLIRAPASRRHSAAARR